MTRNGLAEAAYGYDAFQRRVLKSSGGLTRHFLYDPEGYLLAEAGSAGDVTSEWIWLGDRPLAVVADVDTLSPRLLWLHSDHLGTPQQLTDQAGNLAWDAVLEPFGELADLVVGLVDQPLRLPGQQADPETGLHHNWHRDYDPSLARYLQPDPLGITAGTNLYTYAHANPVTWTDRDGRNPITWGQYGGNLGSLAGAPWGPLGIGAGRVLGTALGVGIGYCALNWDQIDRLFSDGGGAFWDSLGPYRGGVRTNGLQGKKARFYEKDRLHGDLEVWDRRGRHLGTADPQTGKMTKPPVKGRTSDKIG